MKLLAKYRINKILNDEILYKHDECPGNTGNLYVRYGYYKGAIGWFYHCHSCSGRADGLSGFYPASNATSPKETLSQLQVLFEKKSSIIVKAIELPDDFTRQLPQEAIAYMLKYGLTDDEIILSRFGWSKDLKRMIMPVYKDDKLIYWQGRNLGKITKKEPKYKNLYLAGCRNIFATFDSRSEEGHKILVLVEAIISAVKISRHADCLALLGSYFSTDLIKYINAHTYKKVVIWLDPDKKQTAIESIGRFTSLTGIPTVACLTDKKPKQYNDKEVICLLN